MKKYDQLVRSDILYMWLAMKFLNRPRAFYSLIEKYGDAVKIAENMDDIHNEAPNLMREEDIKKLSEDDPEQFLERVWKRMKASDIGVVFRYDNDYFEPLYEYDDAPPVLFVRGQMPDKDAKFACVVGTRKYTEYGKSMIRSITSELAQSGITVVSGMAFGTDSYAASVALDYGYIPCRTVAVLPGGADVCYPASNKELYSDIIDDGLILSKYEPGTPARDFRFTERNKLMAAISRCVILTEGGEKSGALTTVQYAIDMNKPVFCVPGRTIDPMSAAPNTLIASGVAQSVSSGTDILNALGYEYEKREPLLKTHVYEIKDPEDEKNIKNKKDIKEKADEIKKTKPQNLSPEEATVIKCIDEGYKTFDELLEFSGLEFSKLNMVLTSMEFSRIIKQIQGGSYEIA